MTDYLKQTIKTDIALSFAESFLATSKDNYFLFLGKTTPWDDEENPPIAVDSLNEELNAWRNMMTLAKINKNNVMVGVRRYNWEYNKIFDQYDDTIDLYEEGNEKQFYCITDEFNVYKCISNNLNSPSLFKPTIVTPEEQVTEDGYIWKFMFKVREEVYDFLTDDFIPIEKLESILYNDERVLQNNVKLSAVPGSIENIILTQIGSAYPLAIIEDSLNTDQRHRITEVINSSTFKLSYTSDISKINEIYKDYYELYISEGPNAGSKATITSYNVQDNEITVTLSKPLPFVTTNSIYRIFPKIEIIGDGADASIIPVMSVDKVITGFTVVNSGKNYHYATIKIYRVNETYSNITLARPILSPIYGHGFNALKELGANCVLIYISLTNKEKLLQKDINLTLGNDYRQVGLIKNIFFNNNLFEPISSEQETKSFIEIENINSKSYIYIQTANDILTGAISLEEGSIIKQGSESNAYQARGIVDSIEIIETGTGLYRYLITVTNTNGRFLPSSSTTYPLLKETSGDNVFITSNITSVNVTNFYTENTFEVDNRIIGTITNSTAKITKWECDPYGLSGKLYIDEIKGKLYTSYYTKNTSGNIVLVKGENVIEYSGLDSTTGQLLGVDAASVGVIKSLGTTENTFKTFYKVTTTLNIVPITGDFKSTIPFSPDDTIVNSQGVQAKVISYKFIDPTLARLEVNGLTGTFAVDDVLYLLNNNQIGSTNNNTNSKIYSIVESEVLPYYGDIVHLQNVTPTIASNDAEEHIKVLIKF